MVTPAIRTSMFTSPKLAPRSEEHTSELQSQSNLVCRLLLEKKKKRKNDPITSIGARDAKNVLPACPKHKPITFQRTERKPVSCLETLQTITPCAVSELSEDT